jgi:hypothetical protein
MLALRRRRHIGIIFKLEGPRNDIEFVDQRRQGARKSEHRRKIPKKPRAA